MGCNCGQRRNNRLQAIADRKAQQAAAAAAAKAAEAAKTQ